MDSRALLVVGWVLLGLGCPPPVDPEPREVPKSVEHAEIADVAELVRVLGVPIDTKRLAVEVQDEATARSDLVAQLEIAVRRTHFDVMLHLREILGVRPRYKAVEQLQDAIAAARLPGSPVYYSSKRQAIVIRQEWQSNLAGIRPWMAHHLVYASHDQAPGGLLQMLVDQGELLDRIRVRQCLLEGQARLVEVAIAIAADGHTLHDVEVSALLQPATSFIAGETEMPCPAGVRWLKAKYEEHGWENVVAAVRQPPETTEQLMHPQKIGVDFPANVGLPRWPRDAGDSTMLHDDVIGELAIGRILRERGVDEKTAALAGAGWDGDRFRVYATGTGGRVTVWRTLWDRDMDALQFAKAIAPSDLSNPIAFRVVQTGRVVDCVSTDSEPIAAQWVEALAAVAVMGAAEESDVRSTEAVEAALSGGG